MSGQGRRRTSRDEEVEFLARLFHHRWAVPVLALMSEGGRGREVELATRLSASRGGVRQALHALGELDLVARNPGHGHPLRPEYLLTRRGGRVAGDSARIVGLASDWSIERVAFHKWPLPVTFCLEGGGARFGELRTRIPGITDRALSGALASLTGAALAERIVRPARPPAVEYLPTERAEELIIPLRGLARAA